MRLTRWLWAAAGTALEALGARVFVAAVLLFADLWQWGRVHPLLWGLAWLLLSVLVSAGLAALAGDGDSMGGAL